MINGKTVLAYIPARSGSKSIIDKNIIDICGKPLIAYTVEAAKGSKYVDRVILSTDSQKYADIVKEYGGDAPFLRPDELSEDNSKEIDAAIHLINWIEENEGKKYDIILKLEPTSPLRISEDVDKAIEALEKRNADTIATVTEAFTHPYWMNTLPEDNSMVNFISEEAKTKNRQELPVYYQLDGLVNVSRWEIIKKYKNWFGGKIFAAITPNERAIDIDGPVQLELVKIIIKKRMELGD
jgi:CMP-N,N'-diacetyllegionaminic acid synthase